MSFFYEPGEDSFTLVDAILKESIKNKVVLDLGCSTGIITDSLDKSNFILSSDLNLAALKLLKNKNAIFTDLLRGFNQSKIDVVIFNPPYVPDFECPVLGGGKFGREIIDRFISEVEIKTVFLLIIEANKPEEVCANLNKKYKVELIKFRKIIGETIIILKCTKKF